MPVHSVNRDDAQSFYDQLANALQARLLARIARLDRAAFTDFRRLFARDLNAYVHARCFDAQMAQDLVDETFDQVWQNASQFNALDAVTPKQWLLSIADGTLLALQRTAIRQQVQSKDFGHWMPPAGLPAAHAPQFSPN